MLIKVISLVFDSAFGGFNDESIREFLKDKELISATEYHFVRNDVPYLTFVFKYFPHRAEADPKSFSKDKNQEEAWRKLLTEADMGLFNLMRDWRSQRAKKDGMPPYILFTNQQLAEIVKRRPQSLGELMKIDGIGEGKAKKYGDEILKISKIEAAPVSQSQASLPLASPNENGANDEGDNGKPA
jgi:superfamily II DNA helicase RecQ